MIISHLLDKIKGKIPRGKRRHKGWNKLRKEYIKTHKECAACGGTKKLELHHIKPFHLYPKSEMDLNNLIVLCDKKGRHCHRIFGHFYNWKLYNISVRDHCARHKRLKKNQEDDYKIYKQRLG